jgi:hypothetical protein
VTNAKKPITRPTTPTKKPTRFSSRGTTGRAPRTTPTRVNKPTLSSAKKPRSSSSRFGTGSHSRQTPSTTLSTPRSQLPGTTLSKLPTRRPSTQPSSRPSRFGNSLTNAKKPFSPSTRSRANKKPHTLHTPRFNGGNLTSHNKKPVFHPNRNTSSLRHSNNSPSYYNRNNRQGSGRYTHNKHNRQRHNNYFTPAWHGPVVYPSCYRYGYSSSFSIGFNGNWGSAHISSSRYYTPYYNSYHNRSYGYSSVYYGGWRNNWYGGISYACNPWPVYRTYYLYEPEPIIIEKPVIIRQEVIVENDQPYEVSTSELQVAPITYSSKYTPDHIVIEEHSIIKEANEQLGYEEYNPIEHDPEYIYDDQFVEYYYEGDYLGDEFTLEFASYASSLNPESIWVSYSRLDLIQ